MIWPSIDISMSRGADAVRRCALACWPRREAGEAGRTFIVVIQSSLSVRITRKPMVNHAKCVRRIPGSSRPAGQLEPHLHQPRHPVGASVVTVNAQPGSLKILVAIDSAFILLDVQDTLRDLGYNSVHGTCSAVQARAELRHQSLRCHHSWSRHRQFRIRTSTERA